MRHRNSVLFGLAALPVATSCAGETASDPLFELLPPEATGVDFVNEVEGTPGLNILNYLNFYNGGGVAAGDLDGDGLPDLYFTSNLGPDRLFRNKGDYEFEDITERAGLGTERGWTSGVTMADVEGDGDLDIYVSAVNYLTMDGRNALYLNNGDATFTDGTEQSGLGLEGYGTQAAFFDYDRDGDLDVYQLNHSSHTDRGVSTSPQRDPHPKAGDRLLRNDGGRFVDVTAEAGIYSGVDGYGLGVAVSDFDGDGCLDVYIANDFQEDDFLYYNNCDGTFSESGGSALAHMSRSSMGVDAADIDNDGRPDVMVLDMLPEREDILKTSSSWDTYAILDLRIQAGYHPQLGQNTLQLNRGARRFSEIAYLAGVHATDWSWAALLADLDDDGRKDLFVTNGIYRRPNDLDYLSHVRTEAVQRSLAAGYDEESLALVDRMPQAQLPNYAYHNEGDLTFTNSAEAWGLAQPGYSTGATYADLNNSGALDLIVNNVNAPASIYRNRSRELNDNHFLRVSLRGSGANTAGIGAKVFVGTPGGVQLLEQMPTRGFQGSVDPRLHFGLGTAERADSLVVIWPDGRLQVLKDLDVDREITLVQADATARVDTSPTDEQRRFVDMTDDLGMAFEHEENRYFDFTREPLMPHRLSTEGPALARGDVNGDGLDDVFVGGAKHQAARLFVQLSQGGFQATAAPVFQSDSLHEDVDAAFFDADGDDDLDLYVVSAGNEFWGPADALRDRLYLNDGGGSFLRAAGALPDLFDNGSCVVPADFDGDGDVDLFVGSRVVAREYGLSPRSHLLENDGSGHFAEVTTERAPALAQTGMVTSGAWLDIDEDGRLDLVVVGEWMPVRVFRQDDGRFVDFTAEAGLSDTHGWWNHVTAADVTGDGRDDLLLGNLGLNSYVQASPSEPARLYVHDFGRNGSLEQLLTFYKGGVSYPLIGRDELLNQVPELRRKYPSYADFGASRVEDLFPPAELRAATVLEATHFASAVALNDGGGVFTLEALPLQAQFAPIYDMLADDFDGDGHVDLIAAGNLHAVQPSLGRYDASYGLLMRGDGEGRFQPMDPEVSDLVIDGQVRGLELVRDAQGRRLIVVARNGASLQVLHHTH